MKIGLIGKNIGYSKSKEIFEKQYGVEYFPFDIDENQIPGIIKYMKDNGFAGFNVTVPYKETIQKYIDYAFMRINGTNVVKFKDGQTEGWTVDYQAWFDSIPNEVFEKFPNGIRSIAILGNGGAANSIHRAFQWKPFMGVKDNNIIVYARNPKLIAGEAYRTRQLEDFDCSQHDLIINTIPFKANLKIDFDSTNKFIYSDLNYANDTLVNLAKQNPNCVFAQNGFEMLKKNAEYTYNLLR